MRRFCFGMAVMLFVSAARAADVADQPYLVLNTGGHTAPVTENSVHAGRQGSRHRRGGQDGLPVGRRQRRAPRRLSAAGRAGSAGSVEDRRPLDGRQDPGRRRRRLHGGREPRRFRLPHRPGRRPRRCRPAAKARRWGDRPFARRQTPGDELFRQQNLPLGPGFEEGAVHPDRPQGPRHRPGLFARRRPAGQHLFRQDRPPLVHGGRHGGLPAARTSGRGALCRLEGQ